ncbi:MAG: hypothetical protein KBS74_00275 [Clostridiales bacterium]|nr:hypothetical protein [Candidatus Cacconaster stercorequi]
MKSVTVFVIQFKLTTEKKLNTGAFAELDSREAMEVDGGYKFIDDYTPTKSTSSKSSTKSSTYTWRDAFFDIGKTLGQTKAAGLW